MTTGDDTRMVDGIEFLTGATVWAYDDGTVRVVPWRHVFGNIQAGRFGCVPAPEVGWTRYVDPEASEVSDAE